MDQKLLPCSGIIVCHRLQVKDGYSAKNYFSSNNFSINAQKFQLLKISTVVFAHTKIFLKSKKRLKTLRPDPDPNFREEVSDRNNFRKLILVLKFYVSSAQLFHIFSWGWEEYSLP